MASPDSHNMRAVLAVRGFRRLLGVRLSSQFADGLFQAALAGSVLFNPDRQASAMAIAAGSALLVVPYSVIGPYWGFSLTGGAAGRWWCGRTWPAQSSSCRLR